MKLKPGVKTAGVRPELALALYVLEGIFTERNASLTVTALTDGKHKPGSLHYVGCAVDIRSKAVLRPELDGLVASARAALGDEFDVILEDRDGPNEHIHVEFDPK